MARPCGRHSPNNGICISGSCILVLERYKHSASTSIGSGHNWELVLQQPHGCHSQLSGNIDSSVVHASSLQRAMYCTWEFMTTCWNMLAWKSQCVCIVLMNLFEGNFV